ncbi:hypothetical protein VTK56DRAFT_7762 [Thermocarpiscus australiensis]
MQTRSATRRLAVAAATVSDIPTTARGAPETPLTQTSANVPLLTTSRGSGSVTAAGSKRKRASKEKVQPLKGGWVLPHGMGVGVAGSVPPSDQGAESALPASPPEETSAAAADRVQDARPTLTAQPKGKKNTAPRQTKQTRLSLRVTKAGVKVEKGNQDEQALAVKVEESTDKIDAFIKQEDDEDSRPTKRVRATRVASEKASDITSAAEGALEHIQKKVKEENIITETIPKLLIVKGITVRNNTVAKTLDRVVVDATRLLNPDFRIKVKRGKENPYGLTPGFSPYPYRRIPTPEACEEVHRILTELHGEVKQPERIPAASLETAGCGEVPCVLDALLRTLISGNTLMALADAAVKKLAAHYGTCQEGSGAGSINWDKVRLSSHQELTQVIKIAGNGPKKSQHIKQILDMVYEENLQRVKEQSAAALVDPSQEPAKTTTMQNLLSLDYMHRMSKDEAMTKFVSYPGIGIKTAACVTLFCLRIPCFAVDTHVHKFCRWLGWVPEKADPDNCFRHGDVMVPDHLKYGLHQLFIRHGQQCFKCRKATRPGTKEWNEAPECPLEHLLDRSKDEAGPRGKKKKVVEEDAGSETDDSDGAVSDEDDGEE